MVGLLAVGVLVAGVGLGLEDSGADEAPDVDDDPVSEDDFDDRESVR